MDKVIKIINGIGSSIGENRRTLRIILLLVLALSCFLNLYGIRWGLPALWYPDESETIESIVIPMARNLDPNPHIFNKPSLYYYFLEISLLPYFLYLRIFSIPIESYTNFVGTVTLISRFVTALTGVLGVFIMYLLGKNLCNEKTGLFASLLLTINLGYSSYSHFAYMEVPMLVLILGTLFLCFRYLDNQKVSFLYWASFIGGFAVSTKFNAGLLVGAAIIICHFVRMRSQIRTEHSVRDIFMVFFSRELFFSLALVIVGFLIFTPFAVLDYKTFCAYILKQIFITKGYKVFEESFTWAKNFVRLKNGFGSPLFVLMVFAFLYGLIRFIKQPSGKEAIVFSIPILYYAYIGTWRVAAFRYVLPMTPFLILSAGLFLFHVRKWRNLLRRITFVVLGIIVVYSFLFTFRGVRCFSNDTRELATQWMEEHVDAGSRIEVYSYMSYLPRFSDRVIVRRITPNYISESQRYERFRKSRIGAQLLGRMDDQYEEIDNKSEFHLEALYQRNPDYIILSSFYYERYLSKEKDVREMPYPELTEYFQYLVDEEAGYRTVVRMENRRMSDFYLNPTISVLQKMGDLED